MRKGVKANLLSAAVLISVLTISIIVAVIPTVYAPKTNVSLTTYFYPYIGVGTPTRITWIPSPNPFLSPPYQVKRLPTTIEQAYGIGSPYTPDKRWPNATVTFIRPNGSYFSVNGPFEVYYGTGAGANPFIHLVFTPDMKGTWTVRFYWPGDNLYNPINKTDSFYVGDHINYPRKSWAGLALRPYPAVGLSQQLLISAWITPPPMTAYENYRGITFTFTKPGGSSFKMGPIDTELPGTLWFEIYPDVLGNWTVKMEFPGDHFTAPCSVTMTFTVQKEWIPNPYPYGSIPLPSQQWSFPINAFNKEWREIAGPWFSAYYNMSGGSWNPYTQAPKSAHILWKLPPVSGMGGYIGSPYGANVDGMYSPTTLAITTVMAGRGYGTAGGYIYCVDMLTGEILWKTSGSFQVGAVRSRQPVLYNLGTRFIEYNALTGAVARNLTGVSPVGTIWWDGTYFYNARSASWNDTLQDWVGGSVQKYDPSTGTVLWTATFNAPSLSLNYAIMYKGLLIARCFKTGTIVVQKLMALNLTSGTLAYDKKIMDITDTSTWVYRQGPAIGSGFGLVYFAGTAYDDYQMVYFAFNATTGDLKWVCKIPQEYYPWGNFYAYMPQASAYGMIYVLSYAGVFAVNATNGKIVWHYSAGNAGSETPYNTWPFGSVGPIVGGGVVFAPNTEHSPTLYYRGERLHAINAFTGEGLWSIIGGWNPRSLAYGILVATNTYDGYTYAFGKGPTNTTISVSPTVVANGSSVLITGTVTDQSPAQKGMPAVADECMSAWMEYLHMQQAIPSDVKGVPVKITAVDQNGKAYFIGTVTSDMSGKYGITWAPPAEGTYTIYATFEGSESYWGSYASAVVGVGPAPEKPPQPSIEIPQAPDYTPIFVVITVAVVVAIIIGIANLYALRRRK